MTSKILFDASSTNTTSAAFVVPPGSCALINAWNLGPGEVATVWRALAAPGAIPTDSEGKCSPGVTISGGQLIRVEPYEPCNSPVQVGETATQNITSLVLQQPGTYNLHLTPAALGTAIVEVVFLEGAEACAQAAQMCCCTPQQNFAGSSASPCLTITPGGTNGMAPVFDIDACCLLQSIVTVGVPALTDTVIIMQGGSCVRATLQDITDLVVACGVIQGFPVQAPAVGDTIVGLDVGLNCVRFNASALVPANETPWTGTSLNPNLTITLAGVNGHAPTFDYDWCADLQAQTVCSCEPDPGDLVPIVQGGACVLATWPTVDVCDQFGLLTTGALAVGDLVPIREAGGNCKLVLATDLSGGTSFPLLAPDGTCAAPTYSFATDPTSGMWFDPALGPSGAVVISDHNCTNQINVGASIELNATVGDINLIANDDILAIATNGTMSLHANGAALLRSAASTVTAEAATSFGVTTAAVARISIDSAGAWNLAGNPGLAGQQISSQGVGLPPIWQNPVAVPTFPLRAPTDGTVPQYSFTACTAAGLLYDGANMILTVFRAGQLGSRLVIPCASVQDMVLESETTNVAGSRAASLTMKGGESQGANVAPFQNQGGDVLLSGGRSFSGLGGSVTIEGGDSVFTIAGGGQARGGSIFLTAGDGSQTPGNITIRTAASSNTEYTGSGHITLRTDAIRAGIAPAFRMDHHNDQPYGFNCLFDWPGSSSGPFRIANCSGDATQPRGQHMTWRGGQGANILNSGEGGNLEFIGGNAFNNGNAKGGSVCLAGGTASGVATKGYVQLERTTSSPVTAPSVESGYAPIIIFDDGANVHLVAWCQSVGAWQAV